MSTLDSINVVSIEIPAAISTAVVEVPGERGSKGDAGPAGPAGPANVLTIGTVVTGSPDSLAFATITGEPPNQVLNLTIPQGWQGPAGTPGPQGLTGKGLLVLGKNDVVPANTPPGTIIFRTS